MHQPVAEVMQVQAFGGHVGAEQDAHGIILAPEAIDQVLLLGIRHAAVQDLELGGLQTGSLGQLLLQPAQGFDAFGEDDQAV